MGRFFSKNHTNSRMLALAMAGLGTFMTTPSTQAFDARTTLNVINLFRAGYTGECTSLRDENTPKFEYWDLQYAYDFNPERTYDFRLYRVHCMNGPYYEAHVFYSFDDHAGIKQVQFATPEFDLTYKNGNSENNAYNVTITGFSTNDLLSNSEVDPVEQTIFSFSKWRGSGDASSAGTWKLHEGQFVLVSYDIDASYDGEWDRRRIFGEGSAD